ncbi:hypothetical protein L3X38_018420 [Prunus dulcis]|uniref:Retrovirus-related Pol polyprotein from transposon TNT 1-94-like beta-barrel domain-containing protein n=1 Tax=Prunus dulcis TaxID=3755 RepID=A0AAD4W9Z0_PRUDU|nr:hypothetical protein L3X38_018420 [Prunus dulcis]
MKEELQNLQMEEGGDLTENLNTFNRCITGLQKVDLVYSMEDEVLMLLASLPLSYEHFRKTLINFKEMVQNLVHHGLTQNSGDSSQGAGLLTWTRERGYSSKRRSPKFKNNEMCFECGFTNHWKWYCPLEESNGDVMASSLSMGSVWILDSRCSYHVCSNRSVFDTYEERKASKISLGTVKIKI